jgi:aminoglycoside N3'-acetyltransferase
MARTEALPAPQIMAVLQRLLAAAIDLPEDETIAEAAIFGEVPGWDSYSHLVFLESVAEAFSITITADAIDSTLCLPDLTRLVAEDMPRAPVGPTLDFLSALCPGGLRQDDVLYVHSRWQGLAPVVGGLVGLLALLRGHNQGRTVIVPAFPFSSRTYAQILDQRPAFDPTRTPPATGLLPTLLWRHPQALRSAHPLLSECAIGPKARWLTEAAHTGAHPFHLASTYARLLECNGLMVGLGVDIATNAIIHWADDALAQRYPFPLYEPAPVTFAVTFADGSSAPVAVQAYHRLLPRRIKPRGLRPWLAERPDICIETTIEGRHFYGLRVRPFLALCLDLGRQALDKGHLPPWHQEV